MKLVLILGAFLALANALPQRSLSDDVSEILALIPIDDIKAVNAKYADDPELQQVIAYLRSDEFLAIIKAVTSSSQYDDVISYLKNAGLNVDKVLNFLREFFYFGTRTTSETESSDEVTKTFHGWLNEIRALIPFSEIIALIKEKAQTSTDFQGFVAAIRGDTFRGLVETLVATPEYQDLLNRGRDHGVPVDTWIAIIHGFLGW